MLRLVQDRRLVPGLSILLILLFLACDPSFNYRPKSWQTTEGSQYLYTSEFGEIVLTTSGIGDLVGVRSVSSEFTFINRSKQLLVLKSAELATANGHYLGVLPDTGSLQWRTIEAGTTMHIPVRWIFEKRVIDVLGASPVLTLQLRLGSDPQRIEIVYERAN